MNYNEQKIKVSDCQQRDGIFKKVPASELRLDDDFMKHFPRTEKERDFKKLVETTIKKGLKDFWRPICDPSLDDDGRICYEPGKMPAVRMEKRYKWWKKNAKRFCRKRKSRLGTKSEYVAFLAVLIKELVASGKSVEWAWNAVCNDSKELGHYRNSADSKNDFEPTGSREVCGWYDLSNTYKVLAEDEKNCGFWFTGGGCYSGSVGSPLAYLSYCDRSDNECYYGCGWLVFDSCPDC